MAHFVVLVIGYILKRSEDMSDGGSAVPPEIRYVQYDKGKEVEYLSAIRELISKDLSEPYSIYVYRYFLYQWGELCFLVSEDF